MKSTTYSLIRENLEKPARKPTMAKVIAVTNQKGGVGKTTTSVNLAACLAAANRRVLLFDMDPQGNATMGSGVDKNTVNGTVNEALLDEVELSTVIMSTMAGYDLVPSNSNLTAAEVSLLQMNRREYRLRQAIAKIRGSYDFIIIDCPPSLNMLTVNALVASDSVLIPMQCEYYALEGLSALMSTIQQLQVVNPNLVVEGLLRTMYDVRSNLTTEVSDQLREHFGDKVYETTIPRNVRLAEAPSFGMPALLYDKTATGSQAYQRLANEILRSYEGAFTNANVSAEDALANWR